jgi:hypothetical protein
MNAAECSNTAAMVATMNNVTSKKQWSYRSKLVRPKAVTKTGSYFPAILGCNSVAAPLHYNKNPEDFDQLDLTVCCTIYPLDHASILRGSLFGLWRSRKN